MFVTAMLFATALAEPVTYELAPDDSALYVVVYNDPDRFSPFVSGHNHTIVARDFDGTVVWDPDDAGACAVDIELAVTDLWPDPPGYRQREGLDPDDAVDDDAKSTIVGNMLGNRNLAGDRFPTITYAARACAGTQGAVPVTGVLTVRGVGKEITVPMEVEATPERFHAHGTFALTHADFGMKPFTYGPGTPKNREKLKFVVDLIGQPASD